MRKTDKNNDGLILLPEGKSLVIDNNKSHPKKGYVYLILENRYVSEVKEGRNKKVIIGSIDYTASERVTTEDIGKRKILFKPNKNYIELFGPVEKEDEGRRYSELKYLNWLVLIQIAKRIGVYEPLKRRFPEEYKQILALALCAVVTEKATASRYASFHYEYFDGLEKPLTSQDISKLKQSLSQQWEDRENFFLDYRDGFHKWKDSREQVVKEAVIELDLYDPEEAGIPVEDLEALRLLDEDHPEYRQYHSPSLQGKEIQDIDGTNRNTNSENIDMAAKGFNKDGPKGIKCIGELRITERSTGILQHSEDMNGSILDKSACLVLVERLRELGYEKATLFAMDGGCYDDRVLEIIKGAGLDYLINVPHHLKAYKKIKYMVEDELRNDKYHLVCHDLNGMSIDLEEEQDYYYIFYDGLRHELAKREITQKARKEFARLYKRKRAASIHNPVYVKVTEKKKDKNGRDFSLSIDWDKVQEAYEDSGWILLRSSVEMTPDEAMDIYRNRVDGVENSFRTSKTFLDDKASHMHSQETFEGHRFILDIAAILRQALVFLTRQLKFADSTMCVPNIISELDKFRIKASERFDTVTFANPMTRKQKDILKTVGLTESDVKKRLGRMHSWIKKE